MWQREVVARARLETLLEVCGLRCRSQGYRAAEDALRRGSSGVWRGRNAWRAIESWLPENATWPHGVTVSTLDSESSDRGSNPREALSARLPERGRTRESPIPLSGAYEENSHFSSSAKRALC